MKTNSLRIIYALLSFAIAMSIPDLRVLAKEEAYEYEENESYEEITVDETINEEFLSDDHEINDYDCEEDKEETIEENVDTKEDITKEESAEDELVEEIEDDEEVDNMEDTIEAEVDHKINKEKIDKNEKKKLEDLLEKSYEKMTAEIYEEHKEGKVGDGLEYCYDTEKKNLIISGKGSMENDYESVSDLPWAIYFDEIEAIELHGEVKAKLWQISKKSAKLSNHIGDLEEVFNKLLEDKKKEYIEKLEKDLSDTAKIMEIDEEEDSIEEKEKEQVEEKEEENKAESDNEDEGNKKIAEDEALVDEKVNEEDEVEDENI